MTKQKGFTLVELVVVIVILGILAAVAVPRFANLQGDARASVMEGALGAVRSASAISHAKALVSGQTAATGTVEIDGTDIALVFGYPEANSATDGDITDAVSLDDVTPVAETGDDSTVIFYYTGSTECFTYEEPGRDGESPTISAIGSLRNASTPATGCR